MLPAGRHEPFVQRKARRRPYSRCPVGGPLMSDGVFGNSFSVFFVGGSTTTRNFLMDPGKGGVSGIYGDNSGVPVSFCLFFLA